MEVQNGHAGNLVRKASSEIEGSLGLERYDRKSKDREVWDILPGQMCRLAGHFGRGFRLVKTARTDDTSSSRDKTTDRKRKRTYIGV